MNDYKNQKETFKYFYFLGFYKFQIKIKNS